MNDKQIIIDGKECRYWFRLNPDDYRKCSLRGKNDNCDEIKDCFVKELLDKLALKEQECERLKKKLKPKLKNAHCVYFDGQTGWCKAKEFIRCNPIGCKLYTIDELSTIVDLQQQLDQLKAGNSKLKQTLTEIKEIAGKAKKDICNNCGWRNIDSCDPEDYTCGEFIKILQKINEVKINGTNT